MATPLSREWPLLLATANTRKRTLGKEDSGDAGTGQGIKGLQETLSAAGFEVEVSGEFDSETAHALRQFQRKFRLPATGRVNQQTLDKLQKAKPKEVDPAESTSPGLADLPSVSTNTVHEDKKPGGAAGPGGSAGTGGKPSGSKGDTDRDGDGPNDSDNDGDGSQGHDHQIRRIANRLGVDPKQLRHQLHREGVVGSSGSREATGGSSSSSGGQGTQSSSQSKGSAGKSSKSTSSSSSGTPGVKTTKVGGVETRIDPRTGKPIATSSTGPVGSTKKGAYGSVDPVGDAFNKAHPRAKAGQATGGQFIKKGDSGPQVEAVQRKINQAPGKTKLRPDGIFGPRTQKAVKGFQGQNNDSKGKPLATDGVVGFATAGALKRAANKQ